MPTPLSFGLIGAGWIGSFHAETLARRLPNARLAAVADPDPAAAERLSAPRTYRDPLDLIADPVHRRGRDLLAGRHPRRPGRRRGAGR